MPSSNASRRYRRLAKKRAAFNAQLSGARRIKRLFRGLPDAMRGELARVLERGGRLIAAQMQRRSPKKTQALAAGIQERVLKATLRMRAGLIGSTKSRNPLFYGRIQDLGRKAQTVTVRRGVKPKARYLMKGNRRVQDFATTYKMRVRAMPAKRFITGAFPELRRTLTAQLQDVWGRTLGSMRLGDE